MFLCSNISSKYQYQISIKENSVDNIEVLLANLVIFVKRRSYSGVIRNYCYILGKLANQRTVQAGRCLFAKASYNPKCLQSLVNYLVLQ